MERGKLICIEGIDSSGKSTQLNLIKKYLEKNNLSFKYYHFPMYGHNQFSDMISRFLRGEFGTIDEVDPLFVANIYAMDRFRFLPTLKKALKENDVVVLDRYVYSNIAYQGAKYPKESEDNKTIREWIYEFEFNFLNLPFPDLNIFLDVPIEVIKERLREEREGEDREYLKGKQDIHEADLDFQKRVRDNYILSMEGTINCKIIPCAEPSRDFGGQHWYVLKPEDLFESYKKYLDFVLLDKEL